MLTSAKKIMSLNGISDVVLLIFTAVSNIQENVVQGKPQVNISKTSYITEYGFPVSLECSIIPDQNFQTVHVFWTKYLSGRIVKVNKQISNPSLNITFPTFQDSGQYVCSAKDYQTTVHSQPINLTVIGDIPSVIVVSRFYKVQNGQNVTLGCNITAVPNHTNVYWRKQTSEFITNITSSDQRIIGMTNAKPSLTILSTRTNDSGLYTCYADNLVGSGYSMYTNLTVFGSVPVVTVKDFIITVEYGHSVTLDCNVTSDPPDVTVYWQKEHNGLITNITSTKPAIDDIATKWHSLTIEETKQSDSGVYICYAVNAVGLSHSNVINMTVEGDMNYPFVQINSESSIQVEYGGSLTLVSYIRSKQQYPILKIYWQYINNGILTRIDSKTNGRNVDNSSLSIMFITTSESGMYTCVATNVMGTSKSNSIDVNVNGALPIVQVGNRAYESVYGEDVTLVCGISSEPFINNVYWTKDANGTQTIINQRSVGFQGITPQNPSLIITFSTIYDSGEYTCFGTNAVGTSRSEPTSLLVTGDLPDVKAPIPTIEISFGDSVDLICNVKANPLHDLVYWEHNVTGVIRRIFKETDGANGCTVENPSLSIDYVTNTVSGLYTCFAKNVVGVSHSSAINVTVKGGLPEVVIDVRNYKTIYGNKIVLDCKVTAYPKVSLVYWQKQSNNVITTLYNGSVGTEGITIDFPSLVLTRPVNADSGIYTCFASNIAGTQKSLSTKLTVEGGIPIISIPSTSYTAYYGKPITMKCIVVSNPLPSGIFWHKINGQGQVKRINNVTLGISGSSVENPSLTIKFATPVDEGIYFCSAENSAGLTQSHRIKLTVHAGLPIVSVPLEPFVTGVGFSVVLQCSVISIPPVNKVYWQVEINNSTTIINDKSSFMDIKGSTVDNPSLTIQSASLSMSGQYTCFASNDIGTARSMSRMLKVVDTDAPNQTIRVTVDTSDDDTDTIVNGIIGSLSVLVGVGTIILAYMQFRYGTLDGCLSKCKIKNWCR